MSRIDRRTVGRLKTYAHELEALQRRLVANGHRPISFKLERAARECGEAARELQDALDGQKDG